MIGRGLPIAVALAVSPVAHGAGTSDDLALPEFVDIFCLDCHRGASAVGNVDLSSLAASPDDPALDPDLLRRVRDRLRARDMPPIDVSLTLEERIADRPTENEYRTAVDSLGLELARRADGAGVPGVVLRRLNRREFAAAIDGVFGVAIDPAVLPADDIGHGFDHLGEVLSTSPLLVEKILDLAESIARRAIIDASTAIPEVRSIPLDRTRGGAVRGGGAWLASRGEVAADVELPRPGRYRAEFDLGGQQAGSEPVRFALRLDRATQTEVAVPETPGAPATHVFEFESDRSAVRIGAAFLNDYYAPENPDPSQRDRNAVVTAIRLAGPLDPGEPTPIQRQLDGWMREGDLRTGTARAARRLLEQCWCRPIPQDEAYRVADLVIDAARASDSEDGAGGRASRPRTAAVQQALVVYAIASPEFLYRIERARPGAEIAADGTEPIDGHAVAARLGAFLRGGLPDERLLEAARRGRLDDVEGIRREVRRLLRGDAPRSLGERFAVQWLHVDGVERLEPDPSRYGEVDAATLADMREETIRAFAEIVEEDRPITDLFQSSTTWLSPRLARHYGLDADSIDFESRAVDGFAKVDLADLGVAHADLGVLRHASVLASTSNPGRTSPVKRGKWVLESLLDSPPPPPPPGVAQLPDKADPTAEHASLRAMLEAHRADPDCAACHVRMDAIGFALEPFDGVGRWRQDDDGTPIDALATFPDGSTADGPLDLREVLVRDPALRRSFAKHLLVYALGRGPEWRDEPLIDEIAQVLETTPTVAAAVEAIAISDAFRRRPAMESDLSR